MEKSQYLKLKNRLGIRHCPICNAQIIYCDYDKVNIFTQNNQMRPYQEVEIPDVEYLEIECRNCSNVLKFHIKNLLK